VLLVFVLLAAVDALDFNIAQWIAVGVALFLFARAARSSKEA
jgi:hypothetical protein